jgi:hypothetical protein
MATQRITSFLLLGLMIGAGSAQAQNALGELLDTGATALTKAELMSILPGAVVRGLGFHGPDMRVNYKDDGSLSGNFRLMSGQAAGWQFGVFGKWNVDDTGKVCSEFLTTYSERTTSCDYFFKQGEQYFAAQSSTDKSAPVLKRTISK